MDPDPGHEQSLGFPEFFKQNKIVELFFLFFRLFL